MKGLLRLTAAPIRLLLRAFPESVRGPLVFEMKSFVGRLRAKRLRVRSSQVNYMNLGSGRDRLDGFIAVDFFSRDVDFGVDLRYALPIDDAVFDGIFTEHTLEHLSYAQVAPVLAECCRILKPGGTIRIVVPDLSIFVERYASRDYSWFHDWEREVLVPRGRSMISRMEALSFETQEYGHRSAWDFETLKVFLARAGFMDVCKCSFRQGRDTRLLQDKDAVDRTMVSLYVEASKPTAELNAALMART